MVAYYNEFDPFAAQWLKNLIDKGLIAPGDVDSRSITEVSSDDLRGYTQCHFFAGIGVWSYALRMSGWEDDRPVWTGSCPCQPFSSAGKKGKFNDERHLWPVLYGLIKECKPTTFFGEQVASKDGLEWLDTVQSDLEASCYSVGAADLCAASVGAPHVRQRLWIVADSRSERLERPALKPRVDSWGTDYSPEHGSKVWDKFKHGGKTFWAECAWKGGWCGKIRPTEPGSFPLANGATQRVGRLRAYGNAIVPQVASEFIKAYMEI